jgi:hypothetical protein
LPASNIQQSAKRLERVSDFPPGPQNHDIADAIVEFPLAGNLGSVRGLATGVATKDCGVSVAGEQPVTVQTATVRTGSSLVSPPGFRCCVQSP